MYFTKGTTSVAPLLKDKDSIQLSISDEFFRHGLPIEMYVENKEMESFACDICLGVYKDPVALIPCDHYLCKNCANDIKHKARENQDTAKCPKCRKVFTSEKILQDLAAVIDFQRVYCPLKVLKGYKCSWIGHASEIERHMDRECEYCPGKCDCGIIMEKTLFHSQDVKCDCPELQCDFCGLKVSSRIIEKHVKNCEEATEFYYCEDPVKRQDFETHSLNSCNANEPLVACQYYNMGCMEKIKKSELAQHEADFKDYHEMLCEEFTIGVSKFDS